MGWLSKIFKKVVKTIIKPIDEVFFGGSIGDAIDPKAPAQPKYARQLDDGTLTPYGYHMQHYGGDISTATREQIEDTYKYMQDFQSKNSSFSDDTLKAIQNRYDSFSSVRYQEAMQANMEKMAEANKVKATEAYKTVSDQSKYAQDEVARKQLLRNGLLSLTRHSQGGSSDTLGVG